MENVQSNPVRSWWVMLPAGLLICITVLSFNTLGEEMNERK
jgi:ABC-type dipeptide/oligopeptide/nickel transport system permease subunit